MRFAEWTAEETMEFMLDVTSRLNALEFMVEQLFSLQCLADDDPVKSAKATRSRAKTLAGRSAGSLELPPEVQEAITRATVEAVDRVMAGVVRRVKETAGE